MKWEKDSRAIGGLYIRINKQYEMTISIEAIRQMEYPKRISIEFDEIQKLFILKKSEDMADYKVGINYGGSHHMCVAGIAKHFGFKTGKRISAKAKNGIVIVDMSNDIE